MTAPSPLVSILMPTYCRAELLRQAVASAVAQTYPNLEVVVLDNASPDDGRTAAVAESVAAADARVRYVRHPSNLGITGNWRAGIGLARGDYFCLLHDDDTFEPTFVAEVLAPMVADPNVAVGFCDHWVTDPAGRRMDDVTDRTSRTFGRAGLAAGVVAAADVPRVVLVDQAPSVGAALFRRADVTPAMVDNAARGSIDMWLLYGCVTTGKRFAYVPRRLMNYRSHNAGMSASQPVYMTEGHLWRYDRMLADPRLSSIHGELERRRDASRADLGVHLLSAGRTREAADVLRGVPGRKAAVGRWLARGGSAGTAAVRLARRLRRIGPADA